MLLYCVWAPHSPLPALRIGMLNVNVYVKYFLLLLTDYTEFTQCDCWLFSMDVNQFYEDTKALSMPLLLYL